MTLDKDTNSKYLTVAQLFEVLLEIPTGFIVVPNKVGNLAVYNNAEDLEFVGYIDFLFEGEFIGE